MKCNDECDHRGCDEICDKSAYHDHGRARVDYLVKGEKEGEHECKFHNRTRPAPDSVEALEAESARLSQKLKGEPQQDVDPEVERPFARSPAFHTGEPQSGVEPEPRQSEVEPEPRLAPEQGLGVDAGVEDDGSARDVAEASVLDQAPRTPEGELEDGGRESAGPSLVFGRQAGVGAPVPDGVVKIVDQVADNVGLSGLQVCSFSRIGVEIEELDGREGFVFEGIVGLG